MAISRNYANIGSTLDQTALATRYTEMLNKVNNMINDQGPIYSVWIMFQLGKSDPIYFNTSSTENKENLIASLQVDKSMSSVANTFTMEVRYDPFNHGQNTSDKIEALDDFVAQALSYNMDEDLDRLRGYVQYGYNYTADLNMVTPKYQFFLTAANSKVDYTSGITSYTFEGISELASDCNYIANIPAYESKNLLEIMAQVLYEYYGDPANPPARVDTSKHSGSDLNYLISIEEALYDDAPIVTIAAADNQSPFVYCELNLKDRVAISDQEFDFSSSSYYEKPRYVISISDAVPKTISINYVKANVDGEAVSGNTKIDYSFSWNNKNHNLVTQWNPEVDLYYYLIQKAQKLRDNQVLLNSNLKDNYTSSNNDSQSSNNVAGTATNVGTVTSIGSSIISNSIVGASTIGAAFNIASTAVKSEVQATMKEQDTADQVIEHYNATLNIVGIPADPPVAAEVVIIPRILESVSRTAGVYITNGCTDTISTKGLFETSLKLFRIRSL